MGVTDYLSEGRLLDARIFPQAPRVYPPQALVVNRPSKAFVHDVGARRENIDALVQHVRGDAVGDDVVCLRALSLETSADDVPARVAVAPQNPADAVALRYDGAIVGAHERVERDVLLLPVIPNPREVGSERAQLLCRHTLAPRQLRSAGLLGLAVLELPLELEEIIHQTPPSTRVTPCSSGRPTASRSPSS